MAEQETATKTEEVPVEGNAGSESDSDPSRRNQAEKAHSAPARLQQPRKKNNNICRGHLKRWYEYGDDVRARAEGGEVYRCERCQALYLPSDEEEPRTGTLSY